MVLIVSISLLQQVLVEAMHCSMVSLVLMTNAIMFTRAARIVVALFVSEMWARDPYYC